MSAHAMLSASGAHRWLACTPSAKLEQSYPDSTSTYAAEGTLAHSLGELWLRYNLGKISKAEKDKAEKQIQRDPLYTAEMYGHVEDYVSYVWERYNAARGCFPEAELIIEARLDFSSVVPGGFGTGDAVIITDRYIEVIDLKYGKGLPVSAEDNPQIGLYGYGAYRAYDFLYDFETVGMTIYQPRLNNISTEILKVKELLVWATDIVLPAAKLAISGEGAYTPGEHCRFCRARGDCRARAEEQLNDAAEIFGDSGVDSTVRERLTPDEMGSALTRGKAFAAWYADLEAYAYDKAVREDMHWPGWKLVAGRSNRKITDEKSAEAELKALGYKPAEYITRKLKGITELEKLLGKSLDATLGSFIVKPPGKPALVPYSDPRTEYSSAAEAFGDANTP